LEPALAYANIEAIQSGISAGDYSCQEVVQFYVYRIKQHEAYNAVLELNDAAMDHASRIDKKIKNNEANSLFCTVVLIKDNIAHANMHTAAGAYVMTYVNVKLLFERQILILNLHKQNMT